MGSGQGSEHEGDIECHRDPPYWLLATPAHDFDMVYEPNKSDLFSSPPRCSNSVTGQGRGGGKLTTDFSAAGAPASSAVYVLVLRLTRQSPSPCGVSVGKGGLLVKELVVVRVGTVARRETVWVETTERKADSFARINGNACLE